MRVEAHPPAIQSRVLLASARDLLRNDHLHSILCASLVLRLGIEARLNEYLDAYEKTSKIRKREWHLSKLEKQVNKAFRTGDQIVKLQISDAESASSLGVYWYTPVTPRLRNFGEKLGDSLHYKGVQKLASTDLNGHRHFLNEVVKELTFATSGTLTGPPITDPNFNTSTFSIEGDLTSILHSGRRIAWNMDLLAMSDANRAMASASVSF